MAKADNAIDEAEDVGSEFLNPGDHSSMIAIDTGSGPSNVVLTYDDGPEPVGTQEILSALADARATATFFVLLSRTRRYPSIVAEIIAQGHEIALHGVDHLPLDVMNPAEVFTRTVEAKAELEELIGQPVLWFRPPYGRKTPATMAEMIRAGLTPVLWGLTCRDWEDVSHADRLKGAQALQRPGSILLAHDNFASQLDGVDDGPAPLFSRGHLTRALLEVFHGKGFTCCSLQQALKTGRPIWESEI